MKVRKSKMKLYL